jgi:hypothetical protein
MNEFMREAVTEGVALRDLTSGQNLTLGTQAAGPLARPDHDWRTVQCQLSAAPASQTDFDLTRRSQGEDHGEHGEDIDALRAKSRSCCLRGLCGPPFSSVLNQSSRHDHERIPRGCRCLYQASDFIH